MFNTTPDFYLFSFCFQPSLIPTLLPGGEGKGEGRRRKFLPVLHHHSLNRSKSIQRLKPFFAAVTGMLDAAEG